MGTNVGAIPEIISSLNNGILVEPDANVIYSAILKFNKDRNLYNHSRSLCDKTFALWGGIELLKNIFHYNECIATLINKTKVKMYENSLQGLLGYIIACTVFSSLLTIETGIGGFEFYYYPDNDVLFL